MLGLSCTFPARGSRGLPGAARQRARLPARELAGACLAGLLVVAAGCQASPQAERRWQQRVGGVGHTLGWYWANEEAAPARLDRTVRMGLDRIEHDDRALRRNLGEAEKMLRFDIERFERRQPEYWQEILRMLRGKPENIEPTAVNFI